MIYTFRNGTTTTYPAMQFVTWEPDRHHRMMERVRAYRLLVHDGDARNIREAVKMLATRRREWHATEILRHAEYLRRLPERKRTGHRRYLKETRERLLASGTPCAYCGDPNPTSMDHIVPWARGGTSRPSNLTACCLPCNREKRDRTPDEWRAARVAAGLPWPPLPRRLKEAVR